ncbi:UNVERIFIED_CONTAM: Organic cation/carnitine transporter 7 [Sesamum angustifolium]|uniref:Organic cation/carnitine transporter 7 n=1 Tax=Sesamum angustifolium TaxID=2727405 RepID=A0AAW2N7G7_9LAMI
MNIAIISSEVVDNDEELVYTIDEALAVVGFGRFQALVLAYAGLGAMAEAMEVMILSFIGPSVKAEWGLSSGQESLITTVVFAGMLIGAYAWGIISDNYGRRQALEFLFFKENGYQCANCINLKMCFVSRMKRYA